MYPTKVTVPLPECRRPQYIPEFRVLCKFHPTFRYIFNILHRNEADMVVSLTNLG